MGEERRRVKHVYDRYADSNRKRRSWAAENPGNRAIRAELVDAVFGLAGSSLRGAREILDVGCGTGWWLAELSSHPEIAATLHGLDVLPERIATARKRVPSASLRAGDARSLPFEDRSFDAITLFTVLSSLPSRADVGAVLGEARRVLAPRGVLLVWEPWLPNPLNRNTLLISRQLLESALGGCLFESRATTLLPPLARRLGPRTDRLYPLLARIPALRTHRLVAVTSG